MVLKECFTHQGDDILIYSLTPEERYRQNCRDNRTRRRAIVRGSLRRWFLTACRFGGFCMIMLLPSIVDSSITTIFTWISIAIGLLLVSNVRLKDLLK